MKEKLTLGGIGPRLALMSLPYIILSIVCFHRDPMFLNLKFLDKQGFMIFGFSWLAIGFLYWGCSAFYFLKYFKEGKLITKGPFSLCRNPIYSSVIVFIIPALSILFHSGLILSISLVLYIGFRISIHGETNLLKRTFGEEYENYAKSVNEILPYPNYLFRYKRK